MERHTLVTTLLIINVSLPLLYFILRNIWTHRMFHEINKLMYDWSMRNPDKLDAYEWIYQPSYNKVLLSFWRPVKMEKWLDKDQLEILRTPDYFKIVTCSCSKDNFASEGETRVELKKGYTLFHILRCHHCHKKKGWPQENFEIAMREGTEEEKERLRQIFNR